MLDLYKTSEDLYTSPPTQVQKADEQNILKKQEGLEQIEEKLKKQIQAAVSVQDFDKAMILQREMQIVRF